MYQHTHYHTTPGRGICGSLARSRAMDQRDGKDDEDAAAPVYHGMVGLANLGACPNTLLVSYWKKACVCVRELGTGSTGTYRMSLIWGCTDTHAHTYGRISLVVRVTHGRVVSSNLQYRSIAF